MNFAGNIQQVRVDLAELLNEVTPDGWLAGTATRPDIYTGLIHVGHPTEIRPDTMSTFGCALPITLWADETGDTVNIETFYALLSPIDGSLLRWLRSKGCPITEYEIGEIGPREEGPSTFLAVTINARFQVASVHTPS